METSTTGGPPDRIGNRDLLDEAAGAFREEVEDFGGSLTATSIAYQVTLEEMTRRSCMLDLTPADALGVFPTRATRDALPPFISLEDQVVAICEKHPQATGHGSLGAVQGGISRMKRDGDWALEDLFCFLSSGEAFFDSCRRWSDAAGRASGAGLRALDGTALLVLAENPDLKADLLCRADSRIDQYLDHLLDHDMESGHFDICSISRGSGSSPASVCGRLLVMGLVRLSDPVLDPVLDRGLAGSVADILTRPSGQILRDWADALLALDLTEARSRQVRSAMRRIASREGAAAPASLEFVTDTLRGVMRRAGRAADGLQCLAMAAETRLHMSRAEIGATA